MSTLLTDTIINSPTTGTVLTGTTLAASHLIPLINEGHINPIIIESLQIVGYLTTIIVGAFTIYGYIKKNRKSKQ
tara:strand:+ start:340 stop:564 length:225 start_codon:yes stop_codon:yes gene_type:complete